MGATVLSPRSGPTQDAERATLLDWAALGRPSLFSKKN